MLEKKGAMDGGPLRQHCMTVKRRSLNYHRHLLNRIIVPPIQVQLKTRNNSPRCCPGSNQVTQCTLRRAQSTILEVPTKIKVLLRASPVAISYRDNLRRTHRIMRRTAIVPRGLNRNTQREVENRCQLPQENQFKMDQLREMRKKRMVRRATLISSNAILCPL